MLNFSLLRNIDDIVRIRCATASDIPQIRSLEQQSISAGHWTVQQYQALFAPGAPERVILVADDADDERLNGFLIARCLPEVWEIENVVSAVAFRRKGIARSLIQELLASFKSAGVGTIILEVRESNVAAVRLYENIGFRVEGRRKDYYQNPAEDALLYRFTLRLCDKIP